MVASALIGITTAHALAADEGSRYDWQYSYSESDFSEDSVSAYMVSQKGSSRHNGQAFLSVQYSASDKKMSHPKVHLMLINDYARSCYNICIALLNVDGEKKEPLVITGSSNRSYSFKNPYEALDLFKNAESIKIAVEVIGGKIPSFEFTPSQPLDFNKLPFKTASTLID